MSNKIVAGEPKSSVPKSSTLPSKATPPVADQAKNDATKDVAAVRDDTKSIAAPDSRTPVVTTLGAMTQPGLDTLRPPVRREPAYGASLPLSGTGDAFANYQLLSTYTDFVDGVTGLASEKLAGANRDFLSQATRFGLAAAEFTLINRGRLLAHEYGHANAARNVGMSSHLEYFDFVGGEGVTMLEGVATPQQLLTFQLGGLNQSETNLVYLHEESARRGQLTLGKAFLALASTFDDTGYIALTAYQDAHGSPWPYADPSNLQTSFARFGKTVTYEHMLQKALVADLFSSLTWESASAAFDYVRTGQRVFDRQTHEVFGQKLLGPDVALLRSIYGDNFRIMTTINPGREGAWDVRLDVRTNPDNWDVNAIGARIQKLDAVKLDAMQLTFSPYVGMSTQLRPNDIGTPEEKQVGEFGFTFRANVAKNITVFGDAGVGKSWDGALERDSHVSMAVRYGW
ncbi:MAG: hypothetical protein AAB426_10710 [Myxococcota bacterium]